MNITSIHRIQHWVIDVALIINDDKTYYDGEIDVMCFLGFRADVSPKRNNGYDMLVYSVYV